MHSNSKSCVLYYFRGLDSQCHVLHYNCNVLTSDTLRETADYLIVFSLPPLDYGSTPSVTLMNKMRYMTAFSYKLALFIYTYRSV